MSSVGEKFEHKLKELEAATDRLDFDLTYPPHNAKVMELLNKLFDLADDALRYQEAPKPPEAWGLSPTESRLIYALARTGRITANAATRAVYGGDYEKYPDPTRNVYVYIYRLRKKLQPFGVAIEKTSRFYQVDEASLRVLSEGFGLTDEAERTDGGG